MDPTPPLKPPPGPRGIWPFGSILEHMRDQMGFTLRMFERYGDVVQYKLGSFRVVQINHPAHAKHILVDNAQNYPKTSVGDGPLPLHGLGLFVSSGQLWKRQRRLLQPAFSRERLASFVPAIAASTQAMLDRWQAHARSGEEFDVLPEMTRLTLNQMGRIVFTEDPCESNPALLEAIEFLLTPVVRRVRSLRQLLSPRKQQKKQPTRKEAIQLLDEVIFGIIAQRRRGGGPTGDMLSLMMEARDPDTGEGMSDQQLRDEAVNFYVLGHDATGIAMAWTWHLLSRHPEVKHRLLEEVSTVLGGQVPSAESLPRLRYTAQVYQEALRLYPPAWRVGRTTQQAEEIGGWHIPASTALVLVPYIVHRHPEFWENPEVFDPGRFEPEQVAKRPRYAYIPFSVGQRQCIGNQLAMTQATVSIAMVLQRHDLQVRPEPPEVTATAILKPREIMVRLSALQGRSGLTVGDQARLARQA